MVDYPKTITLKVDKEATYKAAIDLSSAPLPPDEVIKVPGGEATANKIRVSCGVAARLVPTGQLKVDPGEERWDVRGFGPDGIAQWAWTVSTPTTYGNELRLEIQPAQLGDKPVILSGTHIVQLFTDVSVDGTWIDRVSDWFAFQWPKLKAVFITIGAAISGVAGWSGWKFAKMLIDRKRAQPIPPGPTTPAGPATPAPPASPPPPAPANGAGAPDAHAVDRTPTSSG